MLGGKSARGLGTAEGLQRVQGRPLVGGESPPEAPGFRVFRKLFVNNFEAFCECDEVY